jgi:predicted DNA-binding transcriptional regulator YafY
MTVSSLAQVVPWVLSFGQHAKVLGPKELKDRVKEEIKIMSKAYNL